MGFIFKPVLLDKVVRKLKRQTRRPEKVEDVPYWVQDGSNGPYASWVCRNGRLLWKVGQSYAVVGGRGKAALWRWPISIDTVIYDGHQFYTENGVAPVPHAVKADTAWLKDHGFHQDRIIIESIRREDVRSISPEDSIAEGFDDKFDFLAVWTAFYDPRYAFVRRKDLELPSGDKNYSGPTYEFVHPRPPSKYTDDLVLMHEYINQRPACPPRWLGDYLPTGGISCADQIRKAESISGRPRDCPRGPVAARWGLAVADCEERAHCAYALATTDVHADLDTRRVSTLTRCRNCDSRGYRIFQAATAAEIAAAESAGQAPETAFHTYWLYCVACRGTGKRSGKKAALAAQRGIQA